MLTWMSWPLTNEPSGLRQVIVTVAWVGLPYCVGRYPDTFTGSVVLVALSVSVLLGAGENAPPLLPPPPQLARARLASSSPKVLPKTFMLNLQACMFVAVRLPIGKVFIARTTAYLRLSLRMRGVTKIRSSALVSLRLLFLNRLPRIGMSPSTGTLRVVSDLLTS